VADEAVGTTHTRAFNDLETFAERSRRADEQTALIAALPAGLERAAIYVVLSALAVTLAILYFGHIQTTVEAKGKILPRGDVLSLQAAQSGIVIEVAASPGDALPAGAVIARIDSSDASLALAQARHAQAADQEQLQLLRASLARVDRVLANPMRLVEERSAGPSAPSTHPLLNALEQAEVQLQTAMQDEELLPERRQLMEREHDLTLERVAVLQRSLADNRQALAAEEAALSRKREERDAVRKLADKKLLSVVELNAAEERYRAGEMALLSARQRVDELEVEISSSRLKLTELKTSLAARDNDTRYKSRSAAAQYQQALANLRQERDSLQMRTRELESKIGQANLQVSVGEGRLGLAMVTMPVAGTIAELMVKNAGEMVAAGAPIATVVPADVPLMVEVTPANKDVGLIRPDVEARIKVDAFPFQQFGTARARVAKVLPAVGRNSSFIVQLDLLDQTLSANGVTHHLFPGLSVQADLITGRQRLLDLLTQGERESREGNP
jgi:HlyD family secretion protein